MDAEPIVYDSQFVVAHLGRPDRMIKRPGSVPDVFADLVVRRIGRPRSKFVTPILVEGGRLNDFAGPSQPFGQPRCVVIVTQVVRIDNGSDKRVRGSECNSSPALGAKQPDGDSEPVSVGRIRSRHVIMGRCERDQQIGGLEGRLAPNERGGFRTARRVIRYSAEGSSVVGKSLKTPVR